MSINTVFNLTSYIDKSITYSEYLIRFEAAIAHNTPLLGDKQVQYFQYYSLNLQRSQRVYKQYKLTPSIQLAVNALTHPIHWLVITEPWCGDSAQSLPVLAKVAAESGGKIKLHIAYRDENPELMDQYLTNGGRAIPKLLQLNENFELTAEWGPRPAPAQTLLLSLKGQNIPHDEYVTSIHKWYADDSASTLSEELVVIINEAEQ